MKLLRLVPRRLCSLFTLSVFAAGVYAQTAPTFQLQEYDASSAPTVERAGSSSASGLPAGRAARGALQGPSEIEPNGTTATATPISSGTSVIGGNVFPVADVDVFSFTAAAGDRVYAATQTLFDASASGDSVLELLASDGTTIIEADNNDGTFNASSSTLAGTPITAAGTYYLRLRHNLATATIRPYALHFRLQSAAPVAEVEPNNTTATATALPASGHVSGTISAVSPGESDFYSLTLNAGDSVYLALDMNPERDAAVWNGRLGFGLFGNPPVNQILVANDANAGATATDPNSEAFFFTVKDAGTYFVYIDSVVATGLGANATYNLSASVLPAATNAGTCTTYTSTDVPQTIPTTAPPILVSSTITVPGNPRIADLNVSINLNHTFMQDIDAHLISPAGNDNGLFTDIGAATTGGPQTLMDIVLDDEAALPPAFAMSAPFRLQPESAYRLNWFDGENAGGTWTLQLRDDANGDGGTLNGWSITVCEPTPPPTCPAGFAETTVLSTDFETDASGFTTSGTLPEWERGLPSFAPITTCNSGVNCFKTDLDNTYDASSNQDLLSPAINLAGLSPPVVVRWAQRYHVETANFDHYNVNFRQVGGTPSVNLFEWLGATMNSAVGNPTVTIAESAGWSQMVASGAALDALAGQNTELQFHLDSDTTVQLTGAAIDDVSVTACRGLSADLTITKTDGVTSAVPGTSTTYSIVVGNAGPDPVTGATVADTFPLACTGVTWTCTGPCAASGTGNISDTLGALAVGATATYTAICPISASATGSLANTATVSSAITDPTPGNNSATDTDTLTPQADLSITKTDGVAAVSPGGSTTYTITASNAGPSAATGASVADTVPAACSAFNWTCVGAGGGTCTASGSGSIADTVNLPSGGSVTYTAICAISAAATGTLVNTATVTAAAGTTDPTPGNNSASDSDTIAAPGALTITPTSLAFGTVAIGATSTPGVVTLGNTGGTPLTVTTLTPAAAPFARSGGTCSAPPISIPAAGSCTLEYTFSPSVAGPANQTLTVDAGVAGSGSISLSGSGGQGVVGVLSANLNFGNQAVGANAQQVLTITNTGSGPVTVTGLSAVVAPFSQIAGGTCTATPFTLAAGASCTVFYRFSPSAAGVATQTVTITADVGTVTVTLAGTGIVAIPLPLGGASSLVLLGLLMAGSALVLRRRG